MCQITASSKCLKPLFCIAELLINACSVVIESGHVDLSLFFFSNFALTGKLSELARQISLEHFLQLLESATLSSEIVHIWPPLFAICTTFFSRNQWWREKRQNVAIIEWMLAIYESIKRKLKTYLITFFSFIVLHHQSN